MRKAFSPSIHTRLTAAGVQLGGSPREPVAQMLCVHGGELRVRCAACDPLRSTPRGGSPQASPLGNFTAPAFPGRDHFLNVDSA
jgi:hypothetical protein